VNLVEDVKTKLENSFTDAEVEVMDESRDHEGHGQTNAHLHVLIKSSDFDDKSRVEQHQLIYKALEEELKTTVHALRITVK